MGLRVLRAHPSPESVADIPVKIRQDVFGSGAVTIEVGPPTQDGVEFLEEFDQRQWCGGSSSELLDLVPQVGNLLLRNLDARCQSLGAEMTALNCENISIPLPETLRQQRFYIMDENPDTLITFHVLSRNQSRTRW